jgi:benzoyl-CoA reductase subunit BamC
MRTITKTIKTIKIDPGKCTGCRACEMACSTFHAKPKFGIINPTRARIHVFRDEPNDLYVPIIAGGFTQTECNTRYILTIHGKEYGECTFCRYSCPSRDIFREPDTGVSLKCDTCGDPTPEGGPTCVQWCSSDALIYAPERQVQVTVPDEEESEEVEEL